MEFTFPYKNGSLDGFFNKFHSLGTSNVLYKTSISPQYYYFSVANCFDRNSNSFCHTTSGLGNYLLIEFNLYPFYLYGYGFQHRHESGHYPKNWKFEVSNDISNFLKVHENNDLDDSLCKIGIIRTFQVKLTQPYKYFKFSPTGNGCTNKEYFDFAEFELFGSFHSSFFNMKSKNNILYPFFSISLVVILVLLQ